MSSSSLDFNNISTWQNIDSTTACLKFSSREDNTGFNFGALRVIKDIFNSFEDKNVRGNFFSNCEKLGLRGWKLFYAYEKPCQGDYTKFIQCVLKSDEVMLKALKTEIERKEQAPKQSRL